MKAKLAKRKTGFCMRMKESWKEMKLWDAEELNKLDWVISALILIFLFFTCAYGDLMLTGNRAIPWILCQLSAEYFSGICDLEFAVVSDRSCATGDADKQFYQ